MKNTYALVLLLALAAAGAGCGSAKEFTIDAGGTVPEASPADPVSGPQAVAPEEAEPAPRADANSADSEMIPENSGGPASEALPSLSERFAKAAIPGEWAREVEIPQNLIKENEEQTATYHFTGHAYFTQHPDAKIVAEKEDGEEVRALVVLTPEQEREIIAKHAERLHFLEHASLMQRCINAGLDPKDCMH